MGILSAALGAAGLLSSLFGKAPSPFTIGNVFLVGVEVPSTIQIGHAQALSVFKLPGGARHIQALGPDPAPIGWYGILTGPDTASRSAVLSSLCDQGTPVTLAFAGLRRTVIVRRYEITVQQQGYVTPYQIECEVLPTATGAADPLANTSTLVGSDVSSALSTVTTGAAAVAQFANNAAAQVTGIVAQVGPVAALVGLPIPFGVVAGALSAASVVTTAGTALSGAGEAASLLGNLRVASGGLTGIIATSTAALASISGAAPANSLTAADPAMLSAAAGHTAALAYATQAMGSVNRAVVGAQMSAGGLVSYPGSLGG